MTSLIGLSWTGFPAANTVAAGLSLVFFALASVFLYSRAHRGRGHTTDSTVTQGTMIMINIPTWKRSYGQDVQQPYRRGSYSFEEPSLTESN
ncbi:uncharacterized protein N7518_007514 [Penicillium psychrosexuale]|uniref:uncharacterized protein n=1 Tax=Penicillium psychrosexuale TaxID=1002107 RepID=UPI0025452B2F|nr:uncharacterized protein N7518_007514 [Penicillium psychrosexuale]KAJ5790503.1 hypothetical protein N7518_007514 [Penicillium psychrosexuale]